jgi:hypothetical protein
MEYQHADRGAGSCRVDRASRIYFTIDHTKAGAMAAILRQCRAVEPRGIGEAGQNFACDNAVLLQCGDRSTGGLRNPKKSSYFNGIDGCDVILT